MSTMRLDDLSTFTTLESNKSLPGMALAQAHAERETIPMDAETQPYVREIIPPIVAVPRGRPWRDRSGTRVRLLLIGSIQGDRRCLLMEPRGSG